MIQKNDLIFIKFIVFYFITHSTLTLIGNTHMPSIMSTKYKSTVYIEANLCCEYCRSGFVRIFMYFIVKSGNTDNDRSERRRAERRVFRRQRTRAIVREKFLFFSFRNNIKRRRRSSARHKGHLFFFSETFFNSPGIDFYD